MWKERKNPALVWLRKVIRGRGGGGTRAANCQSGERVKREGRKRARAGEGAWLTRKKKEEASSTVSRMTPYLISECTT